ncbi:hypothetical protein O3686_10620 [Streptococcus parasanguinis]|uniref:plasmid mobilization protein n=1 Tax=Streptococcus parasanguinis TaxID=1318 RepID=UPI00352E4CF8
MSEKMTVLNIRMSVDEKLEIKERAELSGQTISSYARDLLFSINNTEDRKDNTNIIQEKDERISDLKVQIDDYKKQIEQLHTIILATQKDNQLLLEQKSRRWWQFWR